ncbi:hypothetical protein F5X99DRAFT_376516 [Biscogniauxia marginata]|nr:hypothetical protein F5X99DRAFT_376516 [Biscogniauxia marginata]
MSSIIHTLPCRASNFSLTRCLNPWRHCLMRDRGMILCLNQDKSEFYIPPGWGRYTMMIQHERRTALNMKHDRDLNTRKSILTRRDLPIVPYHYSNSKASKRTKHNERYLVMRWDLDIVLINPKRVLSKN